MHRAAVRSAGKSRCPAKDKSIRDKPVLDDSIPDKFILHALT